MTNQVINEIDDKGAGIGGWIINAYDIYAFPILKSDLILRLHSLARVNMHQSIENELQKLNRESFRTENDAKRAPLESILADDSRLDRSNYMIEDEPRIFSRVATDTSSRKREVDDENLKMYGDNAVATSHVT